MQALLDEIYAAPDDDAPRLVYADWLLEQNDPRGTFIALQLERDPKRDPVSTQEQALLDMHWTAWVGPPSDVLRPQHVAFERGMWSACEAVNVDDVDALDPYATTWGTVRRLRVDARSSELLQDLLDGPLGRSLRVLHTATPGDVERVAYRRAPLAIEEIVLGRYEMPELPATGFPALPKLATITVHTPSMFGHRWIDRISDAGIPNARIVTMLDRLESTLLRARRSRLARLVMESHHGHEITAERDAEGTLVVHTIAFGIASRFDQLNEDTQRWLDELRAYLAPKVTITMPVVDPAFARAAAARGIAIVAASPKTYAARPKG